MIAANSTEAVGLLVANRGEIACRIIRSARALGYRAVVVQSANEETLGSAAGLHVTLADEVVTLPGVGASAYLDPDAIVAAATSAGCELVHPGYGFLSESPRLARACAEAGLTWVGPDADVLELFGDKQATRSRAEEIGIPTTPATSLLTLDDNGSGVGSDAGEALRAARALLAAHPAGIAIKALAGGGGRGIRIVTESADLAGALRACASEAATGFGDARIFAEALVIGARHIEVQVIGTPDGTVVLGDRDCSIQRRRQKLIEIAPAQGISENLRRTLHADAVRLVSSADYRSLATVEFLVAGNEYWLLEVNPRIQVEHTVTEAVSGLDLVAAQLDVAAGRAPAGLDNVESRGNAIELRISAETLLDSGEPAPSTGRIESLTWPTGPGVRIDTWATAGTRVTGGFDPLLGKITIHGPTFAAAIDAARRALDEFHTTGIEANAGVLRAITEILELGNSTTSAYDEHAEEIEARARESQAASPAEASSHLRDAASVNRCEPVLSAGESLLRATVSGAVVALSDDHSEYVLIEAMKMHHPVSGSKSANVRHLVAVGEQVVAGQPLAVLSGAEFGEADDVVASKPHPGVAEVQDRHAAIRDVAREDQLAKIRSRGRRTARENIDDLVDAGSFVEYGPLVIAAQTRRRGIDDLIAKTSGDGLIGGPATVDGREVVVISYDYSVLAGTQGTRNHAKTDRLIQLAETKRVPIVLFAEGGGGRPGDTDRGPTSGLQVPTFASLARLRGTVPLIAIVSGRTFAGNAALAGVCDLIIATPDANIGMGGPAMIEGGGLGRYRPEDIGPVNIHTANGVIDVLTDDESAAVAIAREALGILAGSRSEERKDSFDESPEGRLGDEKAERARTIVPADRLRSFAIRDVIDTIADDGTFIEVRRSYAPGAVTGFMRVDGYPLALIANDNHHLGGAIDVDAARSFTQHLRLAQDHGVPVLSLIDTPGFMVGPEAENEPGVRAFGDLFVAGAALTVPVGAVIIRKGYGLGAMAMATGGFDASAFTIAWPSGEIGPMGLEGAVRLGYAKELAAIEDDGERKRHEEDLIAAEYEQGKAMSAAMIFDIDDVIDPARTRDWVLTLVRDR
ncbi:carboxyl transferase domain-containing protein [Brevibacterium sp. ZH18]|uniref:carboxyl transferase domain-containing protein n=1 Tax=Brevibacterium sp. ZH18 TaxID=2927784 RepID=UPI001F60FC8D|nr:carboxyl transferase domain-containing protein [Brevibacterium sp. ZH18]MCI4010786.1 carbamoyl-phosphate-synthetase [Brevibacterium sp. ZH18]